MNDLPRIFGKYEILDELGRGGFATVYRAHDTTLNREVALKILAPHLTWDADFAARFQQEARIAAGLDHPNIITIYEIGELEGNLFIAMELVSGGTLRDRIEKDGPAPLAETVQLLAELADALDYAHDEGLVHRDIKPSNILLKPTHRGQIRPILTDFGLVKALAQSSTLTTSGEVLGTVEYMAPEQADAARAAEVGPATDIYALGIVTYHMLTGQVPFTGSTIQVLMAHASQQPAPPVELRADLPPAVSDAILRALAKQPGDRFPSASAFVSALAAAREAPAPVPGEEEEGGKTETPERAPTSPGPRQETPTPSPQPPPPPPPAESEGSSRSLPIAVLVVIAVLAVLVFAARGVIRRQNRQTPTPPATAISRETATPQAGAPVIRQWSVFPTEISAGQEVTVRWQVENAEHVEIQPYGEVAESGERTFTPQSDLTVVLLASQGDASVSRSTQVSVAAAIPDAPAISFKVDPSSFVRGQIDAITLSWQIESETALKAEIDQGLGEVGPSGSMEVRAPASDTVYTLTAANEGGQSSARVQVEVIEPRCRVVTNALNLRSGPGTLYSPPIVALPRGTELSPLAYFSGGYPERGWVQVRAPSGDQGWVSDGDQYISCDLDFDRLPVANEIPPTPTATPSRTPTPTPTTTPTPTVALGYAISHFTGTWENVDSEGGMTKLVISQVDDDTLTFHGYGKCTPSDCDWGEINVNFTPPTLRGRYNFGYKTTTITVKRTESYLIATVFDDYVPSDSRSDRTNEYRLKRSLIFNPAILITPSTRLQINPQILSTPTP